MLVVLVLQELTELTKGLVAIGALVGKIWNNSAVIAVFTATIREARSITDVAIHGLLAFGKLVNLSASVIFSETARAITRLDVLHSIRARTKSLFATDWTSHVARTVNLKVHVEFILSIKASIAGAAAGIANNSFDAIAAARVSVAFHPLVATERAAAQVFIALTAAPSHGESILAYVIATA